jgi:hypothetical protein
MIVFIQQAVQNCDRFPTAFSFGQLTTRPDQAFVTVRYVATAGITHVSFSKAIMIAIATCARSNNHMVFSR